MGARARPAPLRPGRRQQRRPLRRRTSRARAPPRDARPGDAAHRERSGAEGGGGRAVGCAGGGGRRAGLGRRRMPVRHPGARGRDADPERGGLRPGGRGDGLLGRSAGSPDGPGRAAHERAMRVRLSRQPLQVGGQGPLHRAARDVRAAPGRTAGRPLRGAGANARGAGPPHAFAAPGPRDRDRAAPAEVDGARSRRSQRAQRRLVLHEPDRPGGRRRTSWRPPCAATAPFATGSIRRASPPERGV